MTRSRWIQVTAVLALLQFAAAIALSVWISRRLALAHEFGRTLGYANDVRARAELTGDEISAGFQALAPFRGLTPCSVSELAALRGVALSSSSLQAIGRVSGGVVPCSSYGLHVPPLSLGPVAYVSPSRVAFHLEAHLPFAPQTRLIVLERDGFAAFVHGNGQIEATSRAASVALALVAKREHRILSSRGHIEANWLLRQPTREDVTFIDGDHVVALSRSRGYNIVGVAAVPVSDYQREALMLGQLIVPFGTVGGGMLAFSMLLLARRQLGMPAQIRAGLRRREFSVLFQPIVELRTRRWVGAEVLLRWTHDGQAIRPDLFIPVAEDSGLIHAVTRHVLQLVEPALAQLAQDAAPFYLSINLAAADLHEPALPTLLAELLRRTGANPERLAVEVTERGFARTDAAANALGALRQLGIRVAIDDFGTGYSSLSYLESFKLDSLKIDKSFVDSLGVEAVTSSVVGHIIDMARSLRFEIIAEGIEREEQAAILQVRGVRYGQGWLYARPLTVQGLLAGLAAQRAAEPKR